MIRSLVGVHEGDSIKVYKEALSFELSGACNPSLRGLAGGIFLYGGRVVLKNGAPFKLIAWHEASSAGPGPRPPDTFRPSFNVRSVRSLSRSGSPPLLYRDSIYLVSGGRRIGLWSSRHGAMIGVMTCAESACRAPVPLVTSAHEISELSYIASPDRPGLGLLTFWLHVSRHRDAAIAFSLTV